jgi:hypothetical protein
MRRQGDAGVAIFDDAAASVTSNDVSRAVEGIRVEVTSAARDPYGTQISRVKTNTIRKSRATGITVHSAGNWTIESNVVRDGSGDGILVSSAATSGPNHFSLNDARGSRGLDCADRTTGSRTGATANLWKGNRGLDASPPAICSP